MRARRGPSWLFVVVASSSIGGAMSQVMAQGVERLDGRIDPQATDVGPQRLDPVEGIGGIEGLRPVEPGVGDISPLGQSLRLLPGDLRVPTGFSRVYEMPGRPGWLVRANGGLYAVFRESLYGQGTALVPEDTTFSIGPPLELMRDLLPGAFLTDGAPVPGVNLAPDATEAQHADTSLAGQPPARLEGTLVREASSEQPLTSKQLTVNELAPVPSLIAQGAYRRYRLMQLMRNAAEAERESTTDE